MNMDLALRELTGRIREHAETMLTEEAVKTAVVLPFLRALGYDVFNPREVVPEFTADAVGKKGEKVDYAIRIDDKIRILIECKPLTTVLAPIHLAQLYRYFSVTDAKFAILTNGRFFQFHSDLESPNKLDALPFLTVDLLEPHGPLLNELKKFERAGFDEEGILANAERLKYTALLRAEIQKQIETPSDDFVRVLSSGVHSGRFTAQILDQYRELLKGAFREFIRDSVQDRISSALESASRKDQPAAPEAEAPETPPAQEEQIATTPEELAGFITIKAIVASVINPGRVHIRDQKSYCGVLIDDNNRRPLARMHFNRAVKHLGLFDGEKEERVQIEGVDGIHAFAERLRNTALKYIQSAPAPAVEGA
ncbi:type I restriction enzyme HsdR N-terminal domain-containing protein [Neomegalonema sp.]|uniref:type I restriction endonuclease n=1 Tax=Neomegalonema sp. TaxID=2039713 RepID=UPI0026370DB7|nr:type I restriction enzyme HsdR N-terminal domain-containing protein [Neomegalonema sp.]MDD2868909.1 type I restriction enzyme HsdR N-terminal domain-containing protein [Neomegalonema sp.]